MLDLCAHRFEKPLRFIKAGRRLLDMLHAQLCVTEQNHIVRPRAHLQRLAWLAWSRKPRCERRPAEAQFLSLRSGYATFSPLAASASTRWPLGGGGLQTSSGFGLAARRGLVLGVQGRWWGKGQLELQGSQGYTAARGRSSCLLGLATMR